jgi:long-chain fatty acid transport protein
MVSLSLLASLTAASSSLEANAVASHKAMGMGGVGVAYAQDSLSAAYNPANAVDVCDRMDIGFTAAYFRYRAIVEGNRIPVPGGGFVSADGSYRARSRWLYAPDMGFKKGFCDNTIAVGIISYDRVAVKTRYNKPVPFIVGTTRPGLEVIKYTIAPYIAYKFEFCGQQSFGITLDFNIQRLKVNGLEVFKFPQLSIHPQHVTNKGYDWSFGIGTTLGWKWHITDCFAVGVTYRPQTHVGRFHRYSGFTPEESAFKMPNLIAFGFAWRWMPCSTIAGDITRLGAHEVRTDGNAVQELELSGVANPPVQFKPGHKLGDRHGTGFGLRNIIIYRIGIDYEVNECFTIRAGYRHDQGAIPASQTFANALLTQCVEDYISCGATWCTELCGYCSELTGWYAHGFKHIVRGKDSIQQLQGGGNINLWRQADAFGLQLGVLY